MGVHLDIPTEVNRPIRILSHGVEDEIVDAAAAELEQTGVASIVEVSDNVDIDERLPSVDMVCVLTDRYPIESEDGTIFERLRTHDPDLPIILVTPSTEVDPELVGSALEAGMADYVPRGLARDHPELLAQRIVNSVRSSRPSSLAVGPKTLAEPTTPKSMLEHAPFGMLSFDEAGTIIYANHTIEEIFGYPSGRLLGESWHTLHDDAGARRFEDEIAPVLWEEGEWHGEIIGKRADGTTFPHEVSLTAFDEGKGFTCVVRDTSKGTSWEESLHEENGFTESAINALRDIFFVFDESGTFLRWNDQLNVVTGYTDEEIAELHLLDLVPDHDAGMIEETIDKVFESGSSQTRESHLVTKDAERIPYEFNSSLITDSDGEVIGLAGIGRDITERKRRERELQQEKEFTESVLDTLPDVFFVADEDGSFLRWNDQLKEVTGYSDEEIAGMHPTNFVPGEDTQMVEETVETVFEEGTTEIRETHLITQAGERIPYEVNGSLLTDSHGEVIGMAGIGRDITERKRREQEIQDQRALLDRILETAPVGIGVFDVDETIIRVNSRARELFDLRDVEHAEGATIGQFDIYNADGEPVPSEEHPTARVLATGKPIHNEELLFDGQDGPWLSVSAAPITDSAGGVDQVVTITEDVTERKSNERELEQRKNELETELNEIFGRISDAVFALDDEWQFNYVNTRAEDFIGFREERLLDETAWEILPEAEGIPFEEEARRAMETQSSVQTEEYYPALNTWFDVRVYPSETGVSVYFRDITERKEHERALEESERRYRTLAEQFPEGLVTMFDEDCQHTLVAGKAFDVIDLTPADFQERTPREVFDDEVANELEPAYHAALDGDAESLDIEYEGRDWAVHTVPLTDEDGEVFAGMAMAQDITERKQRERELKRYETLIQEATDVNAILDPEGTFQYLTPSVERVLGYEPDALIGENAFEFIHPEDRETVRATLTETVEKGEQSQTVEFKFRHTDGSWVVFEGRSRNLLDEPLIEGLVAYTHDVTERKRLEEELRETVQDLEESNERLEQFAYAASHDLQEPLRMISSYLQLIEGRFNEQLDRDAREFIDFAVDGADRMRQMINDLLAYSRINTEAQPLEPIGCDEILDRVINDLQLRIEETDAEIDITDDPLPTVMGDDNQLEHLFRNLISNAIKYSGEDSPEIQISTDKRDDRWLFSVSDNGIGIDPDQIDRIFEVFTRLQNNDESEGTGIGLALCRRITERHGGEIWVESDPGEGSTFYFTLPSAE